MKKENKKHVVDESEIAHFNALRVWATGKTFTRIEILDTLKEKYRPAMNQNLFQALISGVNPPIIRIERNKYAFAKEPMHISRLQTAWDVYASYGNKKKEKPDVHVVTNKEQTLEELIKEHNRKAINYMYAERNQLLRIKEIDNKLIDTNFSQEVKNALIVLLKDGNFKIQMKKTVWIEL